jgi:hypothetical protein
MWGVSVIAVAALAIVVPVDRTAWAGPCQRSLFPSPIAGRDGYLERDRDQRCEGLYTSPVGGEPVQIVSDLWAAPQETNALLSNAKERNLW